MKGSTRFAMMDAAMKSPPPITAKAIPPPISHRFRRSVIPHLSLH
jgi:hypothetical protein